MLQRPDSGNARRHRHRAQHRRLDHSRRPRLLVASASAAALLVGSCALAWQASVHRYESNLGRAHGVIDADVMAQEHPSRPAAPAGSENWLLVGSDSLADRGTMGAGPQRSDTIMVVHLDGRGRALTVTSIPRDSWVPIPGHGSGKVNSAFTRGGPRLLVDTVERLTDVQIDHYAAIDYAGFKDMTDAVGGVDVRVGRTVYDSANDKTWTKGRHHLDGTEALLYVRQRHGLPNGDLDRIERQHHFLLALLAKLRSRQTLTSPTRLDGFLTATTKAITVDDTVSSDDLRALVRRYRGVDADDITFRVAPVASAERRDGQDVLILDEKKLGDLFATTEERQP